MRLLLFTDTLGDVNGVARFIRTLATHAHATGMPLGVVTSTKIVTALGKGDSFGPNVRNVKPFASMAMPRYPQLELVLPNRTRMFQSALDLWSSLPTNENSDQAIGPSNTAVHISTPGPVGLAGRAFAKKFHLPIFGTYHTDFPAYISDLFGHDSLTLATTHYMRWFYKPMRVVLSRSSEYARTLRHLGVHCWRIKRLRPGIDLNSFGPSHADRSIFQKIRSEQGESTTSNLHHHPLRVLYVGRISREKNIQLLTDLWPEVYRTCKAKGVATELVLAGDGPMLGQLRQAHTARTLTQGANAAPICFAGLRLGAELASLYASCDLFAFPSVTDTLGQVVMEAQASSLPALVTTIGGPREVVRHGTTGLVLEPTEQAFANGLTNLLLDGQTRTRMSQAAHVHMQQFSFAASAEHFWNVHVRSLAKHGQLATEAQPKTEGSCSHADACDGYLE